MFLYIGTSYYDLLKDMGSSSKGLKIEQSYQSAVVSVQFCYEQVNREIAAPEPCNQVSCLFCKRSGTICLGVCSTLEGVWK